MADMDLDDRVAVVTGAASGIGRAVSLELGRRGCRLALVDRDRAGLDETAALLRIGADRVSTHLADLTDRDRIVALPDEILGAHPGVDLLVNNAGVAVGGTFEQIRPQDFEWLFEINFWAAVRMLRAFLPALRRSTDARIVNVSSLFGLVAPPGQSAYVASKFALRGLSESLRHELADTNIGVTTIHPGGVATSIVRNSRPHPELTEADAATTAAAFEKLLRLPPATAARVIVGAIVRRRPRQIVGSDAKFVAFVERLFPVDYWRVIARLQNRPRTGVART